MQHELVGVVERDGDGYVGHCDEVGTTSYGHTVEQAFANLREVTWGQLADHQAAPLSNAFDGELQARVV